MSRIISDTTKLRSFCMLAHVDHGKTTLSDHLGAYAGMISTANAGKLRFLDSREDEQERMITMKASTISIRHSVDGEDHAITLIDSPGHIDFSAEVSAAARSCDGALVIVDVVDGVKTQTQSVLRQAFNEGLEVCLVLNKVELLFTKLGLGPSEAYKHLDSALANVNVIMASMANAQQIEKAEGEEDLEDAFFLPEKGNVIFASALHGWGFRVDDFALAWSKKLKCRPENLKRAMWGENYLRWDKADPKKTAVLKQPNTPGQHPMFVQFVMEPLHKVYEKIVFEEDKEKQRSNAVKMAVALGMDWTEEDVRKYGGEVLAQRFLGDWLPLGRNILNTIVQKLPSPCKAQPLRLPRLLPPSTPKDLLDEAGRCRPDSDLVLGFISKVFKTEEHGMVGLCRVFSGVLRKGSKIHVLEAKYDPDSPSERQVEAPIEQIFMLQGTRLFPVEEATAGRVCGIKVGVTNCNSTLTSNLAFPSFCSLHLLVNAVVRLSIRPVHATDSEALKEGLKKLDQVDAQMLVFEGSKGSTVLAVHGEVHATRCMYDLEKTFAVGIELEVSEMYVDIHETVIGCPSNEGEEVGLEGKGPFDVPTCESKGKYASAALSIMPAPLKLQEFFLETEERWNAAVLPKLVVGAMRKKFDKDKGEEGGEGELGSTPEMVERAECLANQLAAVLDEIGWGEAAPAIFGIYPGSLALSFVKEEGISEANQSISRRALHRGIRNATDAGPLCGGGMRGVVWGVHQFIVDPSGGEAANDDSCDDLTQLDARHKQRVQLELESTIMKACQTAFLGSQPRVVEPIFKCEVAVSGEVGKVYGVLQQRRGTIEGDLLQEGTDIHHLTGTLPAAESFGLSLELRRCAGQSAQCLFDFSHWEVNESDPLWKPSVTRLTEADDDAEIEDETEKANTAVRLINQVKQGAMDGLTSRKLHDSDKLTCSSRAW